MWLSDLAKRIEKKARLFIIYFWRILFAKNYLKCPWYKKLKANIFGGYLADQWILYDFDHNDKKEYLSEYDWYRSRYINEPFCFFLNNKVIASEILKQYTQVPEIYLVKVGDFIADFDGRLLGYSEAVETIKRKKKVFIKPLDRGKGTGVSLVAYDNGKMSINRDPCSDEALIGFLKKRKNWFMSESIEQHAYAANLYDKTINTMRIITLRSPETQQFKIFFAVQRTGTAATIPVDNGSQGALVSKIDLATGTLSEARSLHSLDTYARHPDTHSQIEGAVIPDWDDVKAQVLHLANKFPYMHLIAWDILKTSHGICVIEANNSSGVNIIQLWGGQRNGELGDFYRYHNIIK